MKEMFSRRSFLRHGVCAFSPLLYASSPREGSLSSPLSKHQDKFLDEMSHRAFLYFWEQADPSTGLVHDRAKADGGYEGSGIRNVASLAASGFGLTALCIGAERGWISREQARDRTLFALR